MHEIWLKNKPIKSLESRYSNIPIYNLTSEASYPKYDYESAKERIEHAKTNKKVSTKKTNAKLKSHLSQSAVLTRAKEMKPNWSTALNRIM